jgi:porin
MKVDVAAAVVAAGLFLSDALGAQAQGVGWESSLRDVQSAYQALVERGVRPALIYDAEVFADIAGGARRGATYLDNLSLQLTFDTRRLVGWPGATVFVYGLGIHGGRPSEFAGDAQGVSSIEAPRTWTLEEAWLEQKLFGDHVSALVGRFDLNTEFYRVHTADLFLNSSFGIGPEFSQSGRGGPSVFPSTSVGGRFEVKPIEGVVLRSAVLDGVPVERHHEWDIFARGDGLLIVGEAAFLYRPAPDALPAPRGLRLGREAHLPLSEVKLAVGVWHYTASLSDLSRTRGDGTPVTHDGSSGGYVIGDATVYEDDVGRRLRVFGQVGLGDARVNRFGLYTGGGVSLEGAIPGRAHDQVGFGVAAAHNGGHFIDQQHKAGARVDRVETTLELTYLASLASWVTLHPDLQYVFKPNTSPRTPNALVGLIRIELTF